MNLCVAIRAAVPSSLGCAFPCLRSTCSPPPPPPWPAGYALAAFIPISFVCIFPIELMRWIVVGVATLTSGTFIMLSLRK